MLHILINDISTSSDFEYIKRLVDVCKRYNITPVFGISGIPQEIEILRLNPALYTYLKQQETQIAVCEVEYSEVRKLDLIEREKLFFECVGNIVKMFPEKRIFRYYPSMFKDRAFLQDIQKYNFSIIDEVINIDQNTHKIRFEHGIWYRLSLKKMCFSPEKNILHLEKVLQDSLLNENTAFLPIPSHYYPHDLSILEDSCTRHNAQTWYVSTARERNLRKELKLALEWVYTHIHHDAFIFEMGCGSGNNLFWLAEYGYTHLSGSDIDPRALAVAGDMAAALGIPCCLFEGDILHPEHLPYNIDVLLAFNCTYLIKEFSLSYFLEGVKQHLSPRGCVILDQIDISFNTKEHNTIHSSQWNLPAEQQTRPSEYCHRISLTEARTIAATHGLVLTHVIPSLQCIPRAIYIFSYSGIEFHPCHTLPPQGEEAHLQNDIAAIFCSGLFDWEWYRQQYVHGPEYMDPLEHYIRFGYSKGYWPSPEFDPQSYRERYMRSEDVTNPLIHAIRHGK